MILTVTLNASIDKLYDVERLLPGEVMRVKKVRNTAGGKGLNVSRVAALAGENVTATGFVGGHTGRMLEELITVPNITKRFVHVDGETRCCINVRESGGARSTEFLEPGSAVPPKKQQEFLELFEEQAARADLIVISGSMPRGIPAGFYRDLTELAQRAGKPVYLDAGGTPMALALETCPAFIKPNEEELCQLVGRRLDGGDELIRAAIMLHEKGIETVAVSLGAAGVLVAGKEGIYKGRPPRIRAVNTVGCGDSMVAGFAVSWLRGLPLPERIRYAVAVSAANAMTEETGSFRAEDLTRILPLVEVECLKETRQDDGLADRHL